MCYTSLESAAETDLESHDDSDNNNYENSISTTKVASERSALGAVLIVLDGEVSFEEAASTFVSISN